MKVKQQRMLLILLILVAALLAALVFVKLAKDRAAAQEAEAAQLEAQSGAITDAASEYSALSYHNGTATLSFSVDEDGAWRWVDDPEFPLDSTYIVKITNALSGLKPQQTITEGDTLEAYGLSEPSITLTATANNGQITTIAMGNATTDGNSFYMLMNGAETPVYIISDTLKLAMDTPIYDMMLLPQLPVITESAIKSITLSSGEQVTTLIANRETEEAEAEGGEGDGSAPQEEAVTTWRSGGEDVTGNANLTALLAELQNLSLHSCVDYRPSDEAVSICGFDAPMTVAVVYNNADTGAVESLTLYVGSKTLDATGYYVRLGSEDSTIYSVTQDSVATLLAVAAGGLDASAGGADAPA